jgi:predicted deacylase
MRLVPLLVPAVVAISLAACAQGDPPGTAAERTLDRAAGTNTSGAFPRQSDGMPGNPPGTAAERALDRAAGTNTSGAYPSQSDGTRNNPPGTAVGRALGNYR